MTTRAIAGSNIVTFNTLATGSYNNCKIKVTDASSNASLRLTVPTFTLNYTLSPSNELTNAYLRAYSYGITTMNTIHKADMGGGLIRSHLAKMMSNFAINLG